MDRFNVNDLLVTKKKKYEHSSLFKVAQTQFRTVQIARIANTYKIYIVKSTTLK